MKFQARSFKQRTQSLPGRKNISGYECLLCTTPLQASFGYKHYALITPFHHTRDVLYNHQFLITDGFSRTVEALPYRLFDCMMKWIDFAGMPICSTANERFRL